MFCCNLFSVYYYLSMIYWQEYLELKSKSCCHGILVVRLVPRNLCQIMSASWNLKMRLSLHDLSVNRKELSQQNQARHLWHKQLVCLYLLYMAIKLQKDELFIPPQRSCRGYTGFTMSVRLGYGNRLDRCGERGVYLSELCS